MPEEVGYDLLWQTSRSLRNDPTSNWLGLMQALLKSETPAQKSTITFLPIIDLNPNDESCIYSTLLFVIEQAKRMRVPVPCVIFDQALWLKACCSIEDAGLDIVARLGGFHTLIKVMKGSEIEELFNEVYAENTVRRIISGKVVSRALRAHLLAESALSSILFEDTEAANNAEVNEFVSILEKKNLEEIKTFCQTPDIREIGAALEKRIQDLRERERERERREREERKREREEREREKGERERREREERERRERERERDHRLQNFGFSTCIIFKY